MMQDIANPQSLRVEWPAGNYEGEMLNEKRHGHGTMRFYNGNAYVGEWFNDQFDGLGEYTWADGRTYRGQFHEDKFQGSGIARWPDGRVYDGDWTADSFDGYGTLILHDGRLFEGTFKDDYPVNGQMIEPNGVTYLANFDGSTHASKWQPCQRSKVGVFLDGWTEAASQNWIREFAWDDGRRFAGSCIGYRPSVGVFLDQNADLFFAVFDGKRTFAEEPAAVTTRKLKWNVRLGCFILLSRCDWRSSALMHCPHFF
jgi:hypothetical protein